MNRFSTTRAGIRRLCVVLGMISSMAAIACSTTKPPTIAESSTAAWLSDTRAHIERAEYRASNTERGLQAPNRAQRIRTYFSEDHVRVVDRTSEKPLVSLALASLGRGSAIEPVPPGIVSANGNRVEIRRYGLVEWFQNSPRGLEHGFTLETPPDGDGTLVLELDVGRADAAMRGNDVVLETRSGETFGYGGLHAFDASGRPLPSSLGVSREGRVRIAVDDRLATYPVIIDPILQRTADTVLTSEQGGAFGATVDAIGDVNADGYGDLVVSASFFDSGHANEGAVFIFLGGPGGVADGGPSTADAMIESDLEQEFFGLSIAGAGDVNGDGYDDLIVGGSSGGAIFHGGPAGIQGGTLANASTTLSVGRQVAGAGDVNGDGYDDVVISTGDSGQFASAWVFLGSASGIASGGIGDAATSLRNTASNVRWTASGAGDINGDGFDDLVLGVPQFSGGEAEEGAVLFYHGSESGIPSGFVGDASSRIESNLLGGRLGFRVARAGDIDQDGYADVVVGARTFDAGEVDEGAAFVFHGSSSGVPSGGLEMAKKAIYGGQAKAYLGVSVDGAGDVNGDGYDDVILDAGGYDFDPEHSRAAFIFLGSADGLVGDSLEDAAATLTIDGWNASHFAESNVSGAGDLDGDGYDDVVIGSFLDGHGPSVAHVFRGGPEIGMPFYEGGQDDALLGWSVSSAGDVNGDGYDDIILGAPQYDSGENDEGAAFVIHGGPEGPTRRLASAEGRIESNQANARLGDRVAAAGDVNGDGYDDLVVTAPYYGFTSNEDPHGAVFVFTGGPSGVGQVTADSAHAVLESDLPGQLIALVASGAGNIDGDDYDDLIIVHAVQETSPPYAAHAEAGLFHGTSSGMTSGVWSSADTHIELFASYSLNAAAAGDVNGDGFDDIIVSLGGMVVVFHGAPSGIPDGDVYTGDTRLDDPYAEFGNSLASAGDVNGDGFDDIIVGRPVYEDPDYDPNAASGAFVFHGGPGGIPNGSSPAQADGSFLATQIGESLGTAVAGLGDIDGDGFDDVIVGRRGYSHTEPGIPEAAFIYLGSPAGFGSEQNAALRIDPFGTTPSWGPVEFGPSGLGFAVAAAGDVDGDGFDDVLVGGAYEALGNPQEGTARVFLPEPGGLGLLAGLALLRVLRRRERTRKTESP